jgi:hypothetical protein
MTMSDDRNDPLVRNVATFGAEFSRWPEEHAVEARRALLTRPDFRRAWAAAGELDAALAEERHRTDEAIRAAGALARVRRGTLAHAAADPLARLRSKRRVADNPFAGLRWQRIAAGMIVAGLLGGATDLFLPEADAPDVVMLDPLEVETVEIR